MGQLSSILRSVGVRGQPGIGFWCPGCQQMHVVGVGQGGWKWNDDVDRPTLSPSVHVRGKRKITDDEHRRIMAGEQLTIEDHICHSLVKDGQIEFLGDCTHPLVGQTVAIPNLPESEAS